MVAEGGSPTTRLGGKTSTVSDASLLFTHSFMHTHTQAHTCTQKYAHMNTKTSGAGGVQTATASRKQSSLSGKESAQGCTPKRLLGRPAERRESGSQRPWLGEAAPQPEGLSTKVCLVKAMVFPVVMYGCAPLLPQPR